jgi:hypothetical protein
VSSFLLRWYLAVLVVELICGSYSVDLSDLIV